MSSGARRNPHGGDIVLVSEKRQVARRQGERRKLNRRESDLPKLVAFCDKVCSKNGKSQRTLFRAISTLPSKQRVALLAHEYAGLSITETSLITGSPRWAVTYNIKRARENVLKCLEQDAPELYTEVSNASIQSIMDKYAEESTSDEQMVRVFGPVSIMLEEEESKRATRKLVWFFKKKAEENEQVPGG